MKAVLANGVTFLLGDDGFSQVGGSGCNEILNLFWMDKENCVYDRLDVRYKIKKEVKSGSEHFGQNN